jgi:energy-coupling factor transport system substrate-specific component
VSNKLIALIVALLLVTALFVAAYFILGSGLGDPTVPMRFLFVAIGAVIVLVIYYLTRTNPAWTIGTREVVYMALGAALYGVFAFLFNGTVFAVPSVSQVALRPAIAIPILFGYLFGPVVGFFTGAVGNTIGDMLTGWVSPQWSVGNGLVGLISGMVMLFGDKKRSLNTVMIIGIAGALLGTLIWLLNPNETNQMAPPFDQPISVFAGISVVVGIVLVVAIRFGLSQQIDLIAAVVWGSLGIVLGIGFAAIADIWVNGYSLAVAIVGEFIPAAGPNLIAAAILVPILLVAYQGVQQQTGR